MYSKRKKEGNRNWGQFNRRWEIMEKYEVSEKNKDNDCGEDWNLKKILTKKKKKQFCLW